MEQYIGGEVSEDTLDRAPGRMMQMMVGFCGEGTWPKLKANGMTAEDVELAEKLLVAVRPRLVTKSLPVLSEAAKKQAGALGEVSGHDELLIAKYRDIAAAQSEATANWWFHGLTPKVGQAESLEVVETILTRLDTLESGGAPEWCDVGVVAAVAKRGLDGAERARIGALLVTARTPVEAESDTPVVVPGEAELKAAKLALYRHWKAMAAICNTAGLKRGQLIRLGLAKRRSAAAAEDDAGDGEA